MITTVRGLPAMTAAGLWVIAGALILTSCSSGSESTGGSGGTDDVASEAPKLFAEDFNPVCSGATESRAADYTSASTHKVVYFETYETDLLDQSTSLPADWTVMYDENADAYAAVDLVACAVRTDAELAKTCEGYEDEESGTSGTVNWYTATYELTLYQATTGEAFSSTTIEADDAECPLFASFDAGESAIDQYAGPSDDAVIAFLKPFVQP